jgi:hypothetical protein
VPDRPYVDVRLAAVEFLFCHGITLLLGSLKCF